MLTPPLAGEASDFSDSSFHQRRETQNDTGKTMWSKILENFWLKIGAVFLALLLWFHATTNQTYEHAFTYPLRIINLPPNMVLSAPVPKEAKVLIQGKGKQLIRLLLSQKEYIDINAAKLSGLETDYLLKSEDLGFIKKEGLEVLEVLFPKTFKIKMDYLGKKQVKVLPQLDILSEGNFSPLKETKVEPDKVELSGPQKALQKIDYLYTKKVILNHLEAPVEKRVKLIPPEGYNINLSVSEVKLSVEVLKGTKRKFENISVEAFNYPKGKRVKIEPEHISLTLFGADEIMNNLNPKEVKVLLDLRKMKNKTKLVPQIKLPSGVKLVGLRPDSIEVEIK
jgi:YbbR domain-containing protein